MSTPSFKTLPRYLQRKQGWEKLKGRLRAPLSSIPFPLSTRKSTRIQTTDLDEVEVGDYFGGALPEDPFARGSFVDVIRPRTTSAPTLLDRAISSSEPDKPLAAAPAPSETSTLADLLNFTLPCPCRVPEGFEGLYTSPTPDSILSTLSFYTAVTSQSDEGDSDNETHHPWPRPPRRVPTHSSEGHSEMTDEEEDTPQLPGAYYSSGYLFRKATAAAIHPHSLSAAHQAFNQRIMPYSLRRTSSSPLFPKSEVLSPNLRHCPRECGTDDSRPPSYTSSIAPSYRD